MKLLEESLNVHKEMTKLALNNDGLKEILSKISRLTESSLFVFDDIGHLQASINIHASDVVLEEKTLIIDGKTRFIEELFTWSKEDSEPRAFKWGKHYYYCAPIQDESFTFDELGFYQILIRMQEAGISLELFYETYLGNLIQKKHHRTDLILTLETYLAHNCNIQQTAAHLFVHRHTLKYRISQIEKRTGLSLQSPDDRMNLHLAILAYKFVQLQQRTSTV